MTNQAMTSFSEQPLSLCFPETKPAPQLGVFFPHQAMSSDNEAPCTSPFDTCEGGDTKQLSFPVRLFQMLQDSEQKNFDSIVSWLPDGTGFKVLKRKQFAKELLGQYFNGIKYTSFLRQLNLYGFKRIAVGAPGSERGGFRHHQFLRSRPGLCFQMHRTDSKRFKKETSSRGTADKFNTIPTRTSSKTSSSSHTPEKYILNALNQEAFWNPSSTDTAFSFDRHDQQNQVSSPGMQLHDDASFGTHLQTTTAVRNRDTVLVDDYSEESRIPAFVSDQMSTEMSQLRPHPEEKHSWRASSTTTTTSVIIPPNHDSTGRQQDWSILSAESQKQLKLLGFLEATNDGSRQGEQQRLFSLKYIMIGFHMKSSSCVSAQLRDVLSSLLEAPQAVESERKIP